MRYLIFFVAMFNSTLIAQTEFENDSILLWNSNRKLEWNDFKSTNKIHDYKLAQAVLAPSIKVYPNTFDSSQLNKVIIVAQVYTNRSWYKSTADYILIHEQGHFDITEVFARKIRKELYQGLHHKIGFNANDFLKIYTEIVDEHWLFQEKYEEETQHGTHYDNQSSWNKKITAMIKELEMFKLEISIEELYTR